MSSSHHEAMLPHGIIRREPRQHLPMQTLLIPAPFFGEAAFLLHSTPAQGQRGSIS
jgi:hypothetical protein